MKGKIAVETRAKVACDFLVPHTAVQVQDLKNELIDQADRVFPGGNRPLDSHQ